MTVYTENEQLKSQRKKVPSFFDEITFFELYVRLLNYN